MLLQLYYYKHRIKSKNRSSSDGVLKTVQTMYSNKKRSDDVLFSESLATDLKKLKQRGKPCTKYSKHVRKQKLLYLFVCLSS